MSAWHRRRQLFISPKLKVARSSPVFTLEIIFKVIPTEVISHSHQHTSPSQLDRKCLQSPSSPLPWAKRYWCVYFLMIRFWCIFDNFSVSVNFLRLEEWKRGHLVRILHILRIHMSFANPKKPSLSRSFVLRPVLRPHLWRVLSPSMLTGLYLTLNTLFFFIHLQVPAHHNKVLGLRISLILMKNNGCVLLVWQIHQPLI